MASPFAKEFTPELDDAYLKSLLQPIEASRGRRRGAFRRESLERGLTGDPYESAGVQGIETGVDTMKSNLSSQFAYSRAGLQREERLTGEARQFGAGEAEKDRQFRASEAEKARQFAASLSDGREDDGFLRSLLGLGGSVAGGFIGRRFGGA